MNFSLNPTFVVKSYRKSYTFKLKKKRKKIILNLSQNGIPFKNFTFCQFDVSSETLFRVDNNFVSKLLARACYERIVT